MRMVSDMTTNLNVRNLQHIDCDLVYKNFTISYDHDTDYIKWVAENIIDRSNFITSFTLGEMLEKIDEITNM